MSEVWRPGLCIRDKCKRQVAWIYWDFYSILDKSCLQNCSFLYMVYLNEIPVAVIDWRGMYQNGLTNDMLHTKTRYLEEMMITGGVFKTTSANVPASSWCHVFNGNTWVQPAWMLSNPNIQRCKDTFKNKGSPEQKQCPWLVTIFPVL